MQSMHNPHLTGHDQTCGLRQIDKVYGNNKGPRTCGFASQQAKMDASYNFHGTIEEIRATTISIQAVHLAIRMTIPDQTIVSDA